MVEIIYEAAKKHTTSGHSVPSKSDIEMMLREKFGGKCLYISGESKETAAKRNARILRDKAAGVPVSVIMGKTGLSRAAVYKILKNSELIQPKK
jgi:Mor family transcriptional regulator